MQKNRKYDHDVNRDHRAMSVVIGIFMAMFIQRIGKYWHWHWPIKRRAGVVKVPSGGGDSGLSYSYSFRKCVVRVFCCLLVAWFVCV